MGLYDRDYIREDNEPGFFLGAQRSMVTTLIIFNVGVFLVNFFAENDVLTDYLAVTPDVLRNPWKLWKLLTAGFYHASFGHLFWNMFGLWMFGTDVEVIYGRKEFLRVYLTMIVVSSLVWVLTANTIRGGGSVMFGASGAVVGMTVLYILHYPKRLICMWGVFCLPAWIWGTVFIAQDLFGVSHRGDHIAHEAHLAGAAFGAIYYYTGWNLGRWIPSRFSLASFKPRPKLRVHQPDRESSLSDQVDRILEKISREGEASLSAEERQTLEDASKRYQQRRR